MKSSLYTTAVDIWSVGCIFGSLFLRAPLFLGAVAYRCGVNGRRTRRCCIRFFTCLERRRKRTGPFSIGIRFWLVGNGDIRELCRVQSDVRAAEADFAVSEGFGWGTRFVVSDVGLQSGDAHHCWASATASFFYEWAWNDAGNGTAFLVDLGMILLVELNWIVVFFLFTLYLCLFDLAGILFDDITQKMSQYMMKTFEYLLIMLTISIFMIYERRTQNNEYRNVDNYH